MFFLISLSQTSPGTINADLFPPFEMEKADETTQVGYWQFSGHTIVTSENITLLPPLQYTKGSCWTNLEIPTINWAINYDFFVKDISGGSRLAFWFIDEYGKDGALYGGPNIFKGIAVFLHFDSTEQNSIQVSLKLIQNVHKAETDNKTISQFDSSTFLPQDGHLHVTIEFISGNISISINSQEFISSPVYADIKDAYIGLTAQNTRHTMLISMNYIQFYLETINSKKHFGAQNDLDSSSDNNFDSNSDTNFNNFFNSSQRTVPDLRNTGHYNPQNIYRFRSPRFSNMTEELQYYEENDGDLKKKEGSAIILLEVISELIMASYDAASYKELNDFIDHEIVPYGQKWQKRTYKLADAMDKAKNVIGEALHYTKDLVDNFNASSALNAKKAGLKFHALEDLLKEEAQDGPKIIVIDFSYSNTNDPLNWFLYGSIVEILFLLLFIMTYQNHVLEFPHRRKGF